MALLAAVLAALLTVQPALAAAAAAEPASAVEVGCQDGVCQFELDLGAAAGGYWLRVLGAAVNRLPGGMSMVVEDDVMLTLPLGTMVLPDADMTLEFGPDRKIVAMHGTAQMPVPTFGLLSGLHWVTPARVDVGYDLGSALAEFNAPLDPNRRYLYLTLDAGLTAIDRGGQSPLELTVPSGQHTTLVMDLEQPLLYVDGEVNLRYMGDLAFVRQLVDPTSALAWWPVDLVLPQTLTFGVNGVIGQGVTPNLALTAGYQVEPGVFGQWLRLDGALVEAEGSLVLGPQGLLLAGQAHSVLMPEAMTEDALAAQVFIPFDGVQAVYARLQSTLEAPLAAGPASAATALAEAAPALATATVISPTAVAPAEEMRAEGVLPEVMPAESVEIAPSNSLAEIAEGTLGGLAVGTEQVMESAQVGYATVAQGASAGLDWLAGAVTEGVQYTNDQWCAVTGRCAPAAAEVQGAEPQVSVR